MAAIDIIGKNYDSLKTARREKEAEARDRVNGEMGRLMGEFDALVWRAKAEGTTISKIAEEMGSSRTLVYKILDRAQIVAGETPLIVDPLAEFVRWDETTWSFHVSDPHGEMIELDRVRGYQVPTQMRDGEYAISSPAWREWFAPIRLDVEAWIKAQNKGEKE